MSEQTNFMEITQAEITERCRCGLCGRADDGGGIGGWSVFKELWEQAGIGKQMMCMPCFEESLGRKLNAKDFTATTDNATNRHVVAIRRNEGFSDEAGWQTLLVFADGKMERRQHWKEK